jgi:hypothetical protein
MIRHRPLLGACIAAMSSAWGASGQAPTEAAVPTAAETALFARLDAALSAGRESDFFACFASQAHDQPLQAWRARWRVLALADQVLRRTTKVVQARGEAPGRELLLETTVTASGTSAMPSVVVHELAVLSGPATAPRVQLLLECDRDGAERLRTAGGELRCPACNFHIVMPTGWVMASRPASTCPCLDALVCYHPEVDVSIEVGVQVLAAARPAAEVAESLAAAQPGAGKRIPLRWRATAGAKPNGPLDCAAVETPLHGRRTLRLHVITHDRLVYAIACEGSDAACRAQAAAFDTTVASFALDDLGVPALRVLTSSLQHHNGGVLEDLTYTNPGCGVRLRLPADWSPAEETGRCQFRVICTSPDRRSVLRATAVPPPAGALAWTRPLADAYLTRLARDWGKAAEDTGWCDDLSPVEWREFAQQSGDRAEGFRAFLRPHSLLVMQWHAANIEARAAVRTCCEAPEFR